MLYAHKYAHYKKIHFFPQQQLWSMSMSLRFLKVNFCWWKLFWFALTFSSFDFGIFYLQLHNTPRDTGMPEVIYSRCKWLYWKSKFCAFIGMSILQILFKRDVSFKKLIWEEVPFSFCCGMTGLTFPVQRASRKTRTLPFRSYCYLTTSTFLNLCGKNKNLIFI